MENIDQIKCIKVKLSQLKILDTTLKIFGSEKHKYFLNTPKAEKEIIEFENRYGIILPRLSRFFNRNWQWWSRPLLKTPMRTMTCFYLLQKHDGHSLAKMTEMGRENKRLYS